MDLVCTHTGLSCETVCVANKGGETVVNPYQRSQDRFGRERPLWSSSPNIIPCAGTH